MTIKCNAHTHTTYCDGKNSGEEMILAAIDKGFTCLGFSGHCYTPFDQSYCMSPGGTGRYRREIRALQEKYSGVIDILLGTEWDYFGEVDREEYDFTIGSVHYIKSALTDQYYSVDNTPEELERCLEEGFHGNVMAMLQSYYDSVADMAVSGKPDILGHFDLIRKLNREGRFFDESSPAYLHIVKGAVEKAVAAGAVFEINTGGVYRGYRSSPYPSDFVLRRVLELGGRIILSSDAHDTQGIDFLFPEMEAKIKEMGFKEAQILAKEGIRPQKL